VEIVYSGAGHLRAGRTEKVMNGHTLLIAAHIDDFILACSDRDALDAFRTKLLARFDGTYEGAVHQLHS
jgi:hypothetical protein